MVKTASTMLELGTSAPDFSLPNVDGSTVSLADVSGKSGLLVAFICNHCPFVVHIRDEFVKFAKEYQEKGIAVVAISSNDVDNYPQDSPEKMKEEAAEHGYTFPYLYDGDQSVAQAYKAACTPDLFLFNSDCELAYRGQPGQKCCWWLGDGRYIQNWSLLLDVRILLQTVFGVWFSRPGNGVPVTGEDLRAACDAVLAMQPIPEPQIPSIGCNIKWKAGREPAYFTGEPAE